jgi:hypothetical protein
MGKFETTIFKLLSGSSDSNFRFEELRNILLNLDFDERIAGSHHIYKRKGCLGIINLQKDKNNQAKAYQVRQVRDFLINNKLI